MPTALMLILVAVGSVLFHSLEPVVVDAYCLKLALHRQHDHHHILDYRGRFHRNHLVYGLLRIPLPVTSLEHGRHTNLRIKSLSGGSP